MGKVITGLYSIDDIWGGDKGLEFLGDYLDNSSYVSPKDAAGRVYVLASVYPGDDGWVRLLIHNKDTQDFKDSVEFVESEFNVGTRIRLIDIVRG